MDLAPLYIIIQILLIMMCSVIYVCQKRLKSNKCSTNMIKYLKVHNIFINDWENSTINSDNVALNR